MSRLVRGVMLGLCLLGLAACAPSAEPGLEGEAAAAGAWRHWQPETPEGRMADGAASIEPGKDDNPPAPAGAPRAVILALHGFNDYSNAFQDFAAYCQKHGVAVHAYDQQSFGARPNRGLWPGIAPLTADLQAAVRNLRRIYGRTPLYILGESMGGAVSIVAATRDEPLDVDGLILSAPAVWGGPHMNAFYRLTLWLTSTLAPGWTLTGGSLEIRPSDNIEMLRAFSADPLVIKATRTDAIAGLVALMDQALASASKLDLDILLLIGEKDEIIPAGALDDFQSRLDPATVTALRYPEGYHMLLRDLQRARVFADIDAWIARHPGKELAEQPTASSRL